MYISMTEGMWLSLCNICIAEGVRMRCLILQVTAGVCDFLCDKQGHLRPCAEYAVIPDLSVLLACEMCYSDGNWLLAYKQISLLPDLSCEALLKIVK